MDTIRKKIAFYHNKEIGRIKHGCTLTNLAKICPDISAHVKHQPFTEADDDLLEKVPEDFIGGPSIFLKRKAVVDEFFNPKSSIIWQSIVGIDASQLHRYFMCQLMPSGLYTRWQLESWAGGFTPR